MKSGMVRSILLVLGLMCGVFLYLRCTGPQPVTITVLGEDSSNLQAMEALKGEFEKKTGVHVEFKKHTFEDARQKADDDLAKGTGRYDIILQYNFALSNYARHKYVYTIDELRALMPHGAQDEIKEDLFPAAWQEVGFYYKDPLNPQVGTTAIGYPFAANTMLLVYNKKFFDNPSVRASYLKAKGRELEPPKTWGDFYSVAQFLTSVKDQQYGVCLQGATGGWLYYEWMNFLFGMGGAMMQKNRGWEGDDSTNILLNSAAGLESARLYLSLKPYTCPGFFTIGAAEQREVMLSGKVAMAIMWSDYLFDLVKRGKDRNIAFGFVPIPGDKSMLAGGSFYINRHSRHPREAASYVAHLLSRDAQVRLAQRGLCSALRSVYADAKVKEIDYSDALRDSLGRGVYMLEAGPESDAIQGIVTDHLQRAWRGEESVEEAISKASREIVVKRSEIWDTMRNSK